MELTEDVKTVFFRVAQEALTNIDKHARASRVDMQLTYTRRELLLSIRDDGTGFDTAYMQQHPSRGIGLRNMRERLQSVGGQCDVDSGSAGTEVRARVSLRALEPFEQEVGA